MSCPSRVCASDRQSSHARPRAAQRPPQADAGAGTALPAAAVRKGCPCGGGCPKCAAQSEKAAANSCADYSDGKDLGLLQPYLRPASSSANMEISTGLATLGAVLQTRHEGPVERARLLRIACCQLEPEDAAMVKSAFEERRAGAGRVFHELAPPTQRSLLAILDDRASRVGTRAAAAHARELEDARKQAEARRLAGIAAQRQQEQQQFDEDKKLLAKAGQITVLDMFLPVTMSRYRIDYASQIHHPVYRQAGRLNQGVAAVPVARAVLEPVLRPVEAMVFFVDCFIHSLRKEDFAAVAKRMDLLFEIQMPIPFSSGLGVGLLEEAGGMVEQLAKTLIHPIRFAEEVGEMIKLVEDPNVAEIFCAMGQDVGAASSKEIGSWADDSRPLLAYKLGKLAGPLLLNAVISVVAPEAGALLNGTSIGRKTLATLEKLGDGLKLIGKWKKEIKGAERGLQLEAGVAGRAEEAIVDAGRYLEKHPPQRIEGAVPGERFAPLDDGKHGVYEVKDATAPGGIACELHSPRPHPTVPCPKGMGATEAQLAEYMKRKGIDEIPRHPSPPRKAEKDFVPVKDDLPEGFEELPEPWTRQQANVDVGEGHHIQTRFGKAGKEGAAILEQGEIGINDAVNLIEDFNEHGQLRGWEEWDDVKKVYTHHSRGHHKDYKPWVLKHLKSAVSAPGLSVAQKRERLRQVLNKLRELIQQYPELLTHGPKISPRLKNLRFRWR